MSDLAGMAPLHNQQTLASPSESDIRSKARAV
jgi:hypothetical protein